MIKIMGEFKGVSPKLACEDAGGTFEAASAAWINVNNEDGSFVQFGWARERQVGTTNILRFVYVEMRWGTGTNQYQLWKKFNGNYLDPTDNFVEYRLELNRITGEWSIFFGGQQLTLSDPPYPQAAKDAWTLREATNAKWCGEIHDLGSKIPGKSNSRFLFKNCNIFHKDGYLWRDADFIIFNPQPSINYDAHKINGEEIEIWDTR